MFIWRGDSIQFVHKYALHGATRNGALLPWHSGESRIQFKRNWHLLVDLIQSLDSYLSNQLVDADQPDPSDAESFTICNECVLNVNNFYAFKQKVLNVQTVLTVQQSEFEDDNVMKAMADQSIIVQDSDFELDGTDVLEIPDLQDTDRDERKQQQSLHRSHTIDPLANEDITTVRTNGTSAESSNAKRARKSTIVSDSSEKFSLQVNECLVCPAVLSDILQLNDHIQQHDVIRCKVCMRNFQRYANLKRHFSSTHSKPKPFVCDICGLGFSFSVNLQTHAALHYAGKIKTNTKHWIVDINILQRPTICLKYIFRIYLSNIIIN